VSDRRATGRVRELAEDDLFLVEHTLEMLQLSVVRQLLLDILVLIEEGESIIHVNYEKVLKTT
jgi:hypothetical protein